MIGSFQAQLAEVRELRARDPKAFASLWATRSRRPVLGKRDRLMIVAADHPARGAFGVRDERLAMIDRNDLLERLVLALERPDVDGVLGTADILDDLLMLGVLDDKLVFGSMNRGGLQGAVFELDDRFTGYDAPTVIKRGLDGGKMLCRIALYDAGTAATLEASGRAITALDDAGLMAMIEPFMSTIRDGRVHNELTTEATMRSMAIASGLGASSVILPVHRTRRTPSGSAHLGSRVCADWSSGVRCCIRRTVTSRLLSTSLPGSCMDLDTNRRASHERTDRSRAPIG